MLYNRDLRKQIAWMTWHSKEGHIPSAYSILDIVHYLYREYLNFDPRDTNDPARDYFILSKGHGCSALYAVLLKLGLITQEDLESKNQEYGRLATHPDRTKIPGVEASTGSLGNGIGMAVGIALGLKVQARDNKVLCLIGDAESNEGTVWECALLASHQRLGNLCVILDNNHSCDPTLAVPDAEEKWRSFGWEVHSINGHDEEAIGRCFQQLDLRSASERPKMVVANTTKGKGVKAMEADYGGWHSKVPTDAELAAIYAAIDSYE
jgi:transketolase